MSVLAQIAELVAADRQTERSAALLPVASVMQANQLLRLLKDDGWRTCVLNAGGWPDLASAAQDVYRALRLPQADLYDGRSTLINLDQFQEDLRDLDLQPVGTAIIIANAYYVERAFPRHLLDIVRTLLDAARERNEAGQPTLIAFTADRSELRDRLVDSQLSNENTPPTLQVGSPHCCEKMWFFINDDEDYTVRYWPEADQYVIPVHNNDLTGIEIVFCPWCGVELVDRIRPDISIVPEAIVCDEAIVEFFSRPPSLALEYDDDYNERQAYWHLASGAWRGESKVEENILVRHSVFTTAPIANEGNVTDKTVFQHKVERTWHIEPGPEDPWHSSPIECCAALPAFTNSNNDEIMRYWPGLGIYVIPVYDGGASGICINYCPWCGNPLPVQNYGEDEDDQEANLEIAESAEIVKPTEPVLTELRKPFDSNSSGGGRYVGTAGKDPWNEVYQRYFPTFDYSTEIQTSHGKINVTN